jgi:hypothetical protein
LEGFKRLKALDAPATALARVKKRRSDHAVRGRSMTEETPSLSVGQILIGPLFNEPMRLETVQPNGAAGWIVGLVGTNSERFRKVTITAEDLERLTVLDPQHSFNGDGRLLRLGLQAHALGIAYEFDLYFGLSISRVDPLL